MSDKILDKYIDKEKSTDVEGFNYKKWVDTLNTLEEELVVSVIKDYTEKNNLDTKITFFDLKDPLVICTNTELQKMLCSILQLDFNDFLKINHETVFRTDLTKEEQQELNNILFGNSGKNESFNILPKLSTHKNSNKMGILKQ